MISTDMEEINIRTKIINDLSIFITSLQNETHQVLLLIDANEYIHSNLGGITTLIDKTKMIYPITNIHGTTDEPNKYKRERQEYTSFYARWGYLVSSREVAYFHSTLLLQLTIEDCT